MSGDTYERIGKLLREALALLDAQQQHVAAIYVSHALETLGHVLTDPEDPRAAREGS